MTDVHCHCPGNDPSVRELVAGRDFAGVHPWDCSAAEGDWLERLARRLEGDGRVGIGEIGLDRLRTRDIPARMLEVFVAQLSLAVEYDRPVTLHGAKCWGRVVAELKRLPRREGGRLSFLFHGFSRSDGLLPEIISMGGFVSVGAAVLNDHAVNYRRLVRAIPAANLLVETDRTGDSEPPAARDVLSALARARGESEDELEKITDDNACRFFGMRI